MQLGEKVHTDAEDAGRGGTGRRDVCLRSGQIAEWPQDRGVCVCVCMCVAVSAQAQRL